MWSLELFHVLVTSKDDKKLSWCSELLVRHIPSTLQKLVQNIYSACKGVFAKQPGMADKIEYSI